jgi:hypothetical protein
MDIHRILMRNFFVAYGGICMLKKRGVIKNGKKQNNGFQYNTLYDFIFMSDLNTDCLGE